MNLSSYAYLHRRWNKPCMSLTECSQLGINPVAWDMKVQTPEEVARFYNLTTPRPWMTPLVDIGYTFDAPAHPLGPRPPPPFYQYQHWRPLWGTSTRKKATLLRQLLRWHRARHAERTRRMMQLYRLPLPTDVLPSIETAAGHVPIKATRLDTPSPMHM